MIFNGNVFANIEVFVGQEFSATLNTIEKIITPPAAQTYWIRNINFGLYTPEPGSYVELWKMVGSNPILLDGCYNPTLNINWDVPIYLEYNSKIKMTFHDPNANHGYYYWDIQYMNIREGIIHEV